MPMMSFRKARVLLAIAASPMPACSFAPAFRVAKRCRGASCAVSDPSTHAPTNALELRNEGTPVEATAARPHRRRERYSGRYPKDFSHKYKERSGDEETIKKVLAKGITPAGTHVPIMVKECLRYMGLDNESDMYESEKQTNNPQPILVVDCTLGWGGHSSYILKHIVDRTGDGSRLIAFDQDMVEMKKTEERLRSALTQRMDHQTASDDGYNILTAVNQNFRTLGTYLSSANQTGHVTSLLADLGLSSMQIDDNERGFTYKRSGPLDMRMQQDENTETAYDLLRRLRVRKLKAMLKENSDEAFAAEIADGLIGRGARIPETTTELADRVREIARPLLEKENGIGKASKYEMRRRKKQLDSTVARVMQAIRVEVNGEFEALEKLLEDLPRVLAPGGKAVFLTFHSGEDRRVKKSFKSGFNSGLYSAWSRDVVRPSKEERRDNPRSSCCKLRWVVRSEHE